MKQNNLFCHTLKIIVCSRIKSKSKNSDNPGNADKNLIKIRIWITGYSDNSNIRMSCTFLINMHIVIRRSSRKSWGLTIVCAQYVHHCSRKYSASTRCKQIFSYGHRALTIIFGSRRLGLSCSRYYYTAPTYRMRVWNRSSMCVYIILNIAIICILYFIIITIVFARYCSR